MGSVDLRTEQNESPARIFVEPSDMPELTKSACERPWNSDHPINIRLSLPLFFRRYYVTLVAGQERRNLMRRTEERRKHPLGTTGNILAFIALGTVAGLAALALIQLSGVLLLENSGLLTPTH